MSNSRPLLKLMISLEALRDFLCGQPWFAPRSPFVKHRHKAALSKTAHLCCPLKTILLPSLQEHTKQNALAPDENNKHFQVDSMSPTEQAAALLHFRTINLLSCEEREPNFKTAYCVLPARVAFRHWDGKTQLFQASVSRQERQTETERD